MSLPVCMKLLFRQGAVPALAGLLFGAAFCAMAADPADRVPVRRAFSDWDAEGRVTAREVAMGTVFTVRAYPGDGMKREETEAACLEALACAVYWEEVMSAMDAESRLAELNAAESGVSVPLSPELMRPLLLSLEYARLTDGAFDPTLGPCIRLWKKSVRRGFLPSPEELACARSASGWKKLFVGEKAAVKTVKGMRLDLGGIGKGFAVDRMAEVLRGKGVLSFCIDSTSDVLAGEPPPHGKGWLLKVDTGNGAYRMLSLARTAVSTSGNARQMVKIGGVEYSHVLDPRTGLGVTEGRQVSVQAPSAALADALATAGCVMNEENFRSLAARLPGVSIAAFFRDLPGSAEKDGGRRATP